MAKIHYILDSDLSSLLEGCKQSFRDGLLFLDFDSDDFIANISIDNNGVFECSVFGTSEQFDLTERQKDFIYLKVLRLYDDEEKAIKENGIDINNY
jgi:hypothetical protein